MSTGRSDTRRGKAVLALLTGACVIGLAPILVRFAQVGPAAAGFWRLLFALPVLLMLARRADRSVGWPSRLVLLAGAAFALDLAFWHYGIAHTSVGKATVLANLAPVVVTALAWLVFGQRPTGSFLVAIVLAVLGTCVIALAKGAAPAGRNSVLGDGLSLATSFWYALYFLAVGAARRREAATTVMLWSSLAGAALLLLAAVLLREQMIPLTGGGWLACIGLGGVHVAGQGSIAWALGRLPPATASVTVLVQSIVVVALGWLLFNEAFGVVQTAGAAILFSGVFLAHRSSQHPPESAREP